MTAGRAMSEPAPSPAVVDGASKTKPDQAGRLRLRPRGPVTPDAAVVEDVGSSSAGTSEIKSLLRRRARGDERPKSSIGSVKIEDFYGDRRKFRAWRRAIEAQEHLYRLEQSELAMLLYLSTKGEARDILDQRPLSDFTSPGGLTIMWKLLEETYGENSAESFERAEKELAVYRRLPGQSVASYVAGLKRLKMNYIVEDPDSTWSNKAWAQRLLNRAGLSRRDRLDVFYSAGACYDTDSIEKALRHRCAHIHEEERRLPSLARSTRSSSRAPSSAASTISASTSASSARKPFRKHAVHVADQPLEEEGEERDDEDLEQEVADGEAAEPEGEELVEDYVGEAETLPDGSDEELPDVYEAFQAGWKAKAKVNIKKKARGFKPSSSGSSPGGATKSLAARKRSSTCASCGAMGHWKGDPECPNVRSGKDALHKQGAAHGTHEVNFVNYTFMVGNLVECPGCGEFCTEGAMFCSACGTRLCKREWTVVDGGGKSLPAASVEAPSLAAAPPRPMRVEVPKTTVGKSRDDTKTMKLKPLELLGAVDQLTKEEKKAVRTALRKEEEEEAWAVLYGDRPYAAAAGRASASVPSFEPPGRGRDEAGPGHGDDRQLPLRPGGRGGALYNEPLRPPTLKDEAGRDKAKAVRQRELEEFRSELYQRQLDGLRCVPSAAAPRPSEQQARCHHRYGDLLWTANQHGHFARCSRCDLKHVVYYSVRHGVLVASQTLEAAVSEEPPGVPWAPGLAVADTGCRTAVGGARWHEALQAELRQRGITWETVPEKETFQFGSGAPVTSARAHLYPVSLVPGQTDVLRMSEVAGPAAMCPGLVGPSELARWAVQFDFRTREIEICGCRQAMRLTPTRHPALDLLAHCGGQDPWSQPGMQEKRDQLKRAPQTMAFVAGLGEQMTEAEEPSSSEAMLSDGVGDDPRHEQVRYRDAREKEERRWLHFLKEDLGVKVIEDCRFLRDSHNDAPDDDVSLGSSRGPLADDAASITSHEFGVVHESSDVTSEDEPELLQEEDVIESKPVLFLHKEKRKRLNQASRAIRDMAVAGRARPQLPQKAPVASLCSPSARRPGPWRILEIFVATMAVGMVAAAAGWHCGQPVAAPYFDLAGPAGRSEARRYFARWQPDLLVVCMPPTTTATTRLGIPTVAALREHTAACQHRDDQWRFAHDLMLAQRGGGRLLVVYGASRHPLWTHPLTVTALDGLPKASTDLCAWPSRAGAPTLQQPTLLAADAPVLRHLVRRCPGTPIHRHSFGPGSGRGKHQCGRWIGSEERLLPSGWCRALVRGAQQAMEQRARMLVVPTFFMQSQTLPEEAFVEDDMEILADAPGPPEESDSGSWRAELDDWDRRVCQEIADYNMAKATAANDTHNHVPNNNSEQEGAPVTSGRSLRSAADDTHHVPDNNSEQEGAHDNMHGLRQLLTRVPRDVPEDGLEQVPCESPQAGSKLERLHLVHRRLGHPANEVLVRMLQMGGADEELVRMAKSLQCPTCQMRKQPSRPLPARPGTRPIAFNMEVHLDLKYIKDAGGQLYVALSMVDAATCYHAARLLRCREPAHVAGKFMNGWLAIFGVPVAVVLDQGGEFETEFIALLEAHSIASKVTGSYAPWQNGFCERQGALLGVAWSAAVEAEKAEGRQAMKVALACALQAKNSTISRRGHSAHQLVFGRQAYLPELLDEEVWQAASMGQALSLEGEVARQSEMRAAAKVALLHGDVHEKLKTALRRAPGGQARDFTPGELVFFWSPASDPKRRRYKRDAGAWRGPAVVLVPDGAQKYFISWRGRCLLVAAANLKMASLEAADDQELRLREAEAHLEKGYVDLSQEMAPPGTEEATSAVQAPGLSVRRRRNTLGRKVTEARRMMTDLKSVKKMLKVPLQRRRRPRILCPPAPRTEGDPVVHEPVQDPMEEDLNEAGPPPDYVTDDEPQASADEDDGQDRLRPPPPSPEALRRRRLVTDDVPAVMQEFARQQKRRREEREQEPVADGEAVAAEPAPKRLKDHAFYNYVLAAVSEGEVFDEAVLKNEWLSKAEVDYLSELLDMPLCSVRVHRAPRKRLQAPGGNVGCTRTTLMLQQSCRQVLVATEDPNQVKDRPRRRTPFLWRGLTLFSRKPRKLEPKEVFLEKGVSPEPAVLDKDGVLYELPAVPARAFWAACADLELETRRVEAFLLKLKASGKELDPRYFDSAEAEAFEKADAAEWSAWTKNSVVKRLTKEEARRVPSHRIFKVPARVVRTNKAAAGCKQLLPKSRIVLPGHLDPDVGEIRTDSPTTQATAVRMVMMLCVSKRWVCFLFDVSTAFLSGKAVGRELYVRPPRDLKCVGPQELWLILRSAYGLAEAPRLWYERAKELLLECGFEELTFALCTFVWKHPQTKAVLAVLCLHVDDGLLAGDPSVIQEVKTAIDRRFQIKIWNMVRETPLDYLGLKIFIKAGVFYNDMAAYVLAIQAPSLTGLKKGEPLNPTNLKAYRRLVAQLRWPAHHVLPELLFEVSCLAQRVSGATSCDLRAGVELLEKFHELAREGKACLAFPPLDKPALVTFFDASLGKTSDVASAQRGEVHFLTSCDCVLRPVPAAILEFHSNKIARVVRSSMAAECCSLAGSADKLLYNQKLLDALWFGETGVDPEWRSHLRTEGHLVTDAKSVYDHLQGTAMASERQTALDILAVRQLVQQGVLRLHWVPTWRQYADGLTKSMPDVLFEQFRKAMKLSLKESPEDRLEEERRAGIRRAQRERRKARLSR